MGVALCIQCGAIKLSPQGPCWQCGAGPTGNEQLDSVFSDRTLTRDTLEQFGAVAHAIAERTNDPNARFWTFIQYVSTHHPELLKVELKPEMKARAEKLLSGVSVAPVAVQRATPSDPPEVKRAGRYLVLFVLLAIGLIALFLWRFTA